MNGPGWRTLRWLLSSPNAVRSGRRYLQKPKLIWKRPTCAEEFRKDRPNGKRSSDDNNRIKRNSWRAISPLLSIVIVAVVHRHRLPVTKLVGERRYHLVWLLFPVCAQIARSRTDEIGVLLIGSETRSIQTVFEYIIERVADDRFTLGNSGEKTDEFRSRNSKSAGQPGGDLAPRPTSAAGKRFALAAGQSGAKGKLHLVILNRPIST